MFDAILKIKNPEIQEKMYKLFCDMCIADAKKKKDWDRVVTLKMAKWGLNPDRYWKDPYNC